MKNTTIRRAAILALLAAASPAAAIDLFWVGGNINWTDPNANGAGLSNWSLSSAAAPQANIPNTAGESAILDLNGSVAHLGTTLGIDALNVQHPNATFVMKGTGGANNTLFLSANSQNAGTVTLTSQDAGAGFAAITMTGGATFTNTGTFNFATPLSGTTLTRNFSGLFQNSGTVNVSANADFNSTAPATNTGTFTVAATGAVFSSSNGVFNQNAGTLANNGAFLFTSGDTFNFNGGNITGNAIEISNSTLNIGPASTGTGLFRFTSNNNHTGNVAAAQTLVISGTGGTNATLNSPAFTNSGTINLTAQDAGAGLAQLTITSGTATNNGTINFQPPISGTSASRQISGNLISNGTINVLSGAVATLSGTSTATTNNGSFNVAAGGTLDFGSAGTFNQNAGTLANNGSFSLEGDTFNFNGGTITGNAISLNNSTLNIGVGSTGAGLFRFTGNNNHTGNVASAQRLIITGIGGINATVNAPSFSSAGIIDLIAQDNGAGFAQLVITGGGTFTNTGQVNFKAPTSGASFSRFITGNFTNGNGGTVTVDAGVAAQFAGTGATTTNNGTFTVNSTAAVTFGSNSIFQLNAGTLANNGSFTLEADTFNFNGGTTTGNPILLSNSTFNIGGGSSGAGLFRHNGNGTQTGNIALAQTVAIFAPSGINTTTTFATLTNNGNLELRSEGAAAGFAQIIIPSPQLLTNAGQLTFKAPLSGGNNARFITGNFTNASTGTVTVDAGTATQFIGTSSTTTNSGTFTNNGDVSFGNSSIFTQAGGTLANNGSFTLEADTFNFNGGQTTGNPILLSNSTLNNGPTSTGIGNIRLTNSSALNGNIAAAQVVTVISTSGINTSTTASALTNFGTLNISSEGASAGISQLVITSPQVLTNAGTLNIPAPVSGGSGSRFLTGNFTNNGTVNIGASVAAQLTGTSTYTNNSSFTVAATAAVTFGTNSVFTQAAGTLANNGSFTLEADTFNFNGGQTTGNPILLSNSTLNNGPTSTGPGNIRLINNSAVSGNIATAQTVTVISPSGVNTSTTFSTLTNFGTLNISSEGGGAGISQIVIPNPQVLTNAGTLNIPAPVSGGNTSRFLTGNFTNNGTVNIGASVAAQLTGTSTYTNSGSFTVAATAAVSFGTSSVFTQSAGTLANNGSFSLEADTFNFNGGQTTGNPILLSNSTLNNGPAATGPGNFRLINNSALNGNIAPGQLVDCIATPGVNSSTTAATLTNNGTLTVSTTGGGSGVSNLTFPGANFLTNNGQVNILPISSSDACRLVTAALVNNGTYFQSGGTAHTLGPITGTGTMTIAAGNTAATRLVQSSLSLSGTSTLTISPTTLSNSLTSLSITNTAILNLTTNDLLVNYTGASPIATLIAYFNADRLIANPSFAGLPTYLAISEAADLGATSFNGQPVDDTAVLLKYTYVGDANLDGQVDALDYERIDLAIGNTGVKGTAQGDLNYDGKVDALDYEQVDLNIGNGAGSPLAQVFIPEPTLLAPLALLPLLTARRRRQSPLPRSEGPKV